MPEPPALVNRAVATASIESCASSTLSSSSTEGNESKAGGLQLSFVTDDEIERTCRVIAELDLYLGMPPWDSPDNVRAPMEFMFDE
jgi:hypothetical protein